MTDKKYYWHTLHPGGLKERTPKQLMEKDRSEEVRPSVISHHHHHSIIIISLLTHVVLSTYLSTILTDIQILRHAVLGMLPKNSLRNQLIKKLRVFPDEYHIYEKQLQGKTSLV
jgi:ribosomal protein L13